MTVKTLPGVYRSPAKPPSAAPAPPPAQAATRASTLDDLLPLLRCPICHHPLERDAQALQCQGPRCGRQFPVVDGVPILINESNSLFRIEDFLGRRTTTMHKPSRVGAILNRLPRLTCNFRAPENYKRFAQLLLEKSARPKVLVLGGSIMGSGMEVLTSNRSLNLIESDVSFGPRTTIVCDAHDIPFGDGEVDGIVLQAVLDDLVDPQRCIAEIRRVLRDGGLVYAETAFVQPVLDGRYDFFRFTHLGHRRAFREFEEVSSGATGGPGMALAGIYQAFLLSLARSKTTRAAAGVFGRLTAWWLKYVDRLLIDRPGAFDVASGYFFMGAKGNRVLSDHELVALYRGTK